MVGPARARCFKQTLSWPAMLPLRAPTISQRLFVRAIHLHHASQGCPGNFPTFRERLLETRRCGAVPFLDLDFRASKKVSHAEARRRGETVERPDLRGSPGSLRSLGARSAPAQICKALQESNALMLLKCATTLRVSASPRANSFGGAQEMFAVLAAAPRFDTFPGQPCASRGRNRAPRYPAFRPAIYAAGHATACRPAAMIHPIRRARRA